MVSMFGLENTFVKIIHHSRHLHPNRHRRLRYRQYIEVVNLVGRAFWQDKTELNFFFFFLASGVIYFQFGGLLGCVYFRKEK